MNVRYYTIAKDAFEAGDCPTCTRCGSTMRHVTEINGALYGSNCGKIVLASIENAEREINTLVAEAAAIAPAAAARFKRGELTAVEIQTRIGSCLDAGRFEYAKAWRLLYTAICKQKITPKFSAAPEPTPAPVISDTTHRLALVYAAARAIVDRKIDTSAKYAVWDVIAEFGRTRIVNGVLLTNPFYDHLDVMDWETSDSLQNQVLTVVKALVSQPEQRRG